MRFLFTFVLACLPLLSLCADNVDDVKKQINKIKRIISTFMQSRLLLQRPMHAAMLKASCMRR